MPFTDGAEAPVAPNLMTKEQPDKGEVGLAFGPHPASLVSWWLVAPSSQSPMASASANRRQGCVDIDMVVQLAPGEYHTVREVEENGWDLPPRAPLMIPQIPPFSVNQATRMEELVAPGVPVRLSSKRSAPSSGMEQPVSKRVATPFASTSDVAIPNANRIKITEVEQCPDFWAMAVQELYDWRQSVVIMDRTILGYFQQALKEAEEDLKRATLENAARQNANQVCSSFPSTPENGRKRAIRRIRSVKEETPAPSASPSPAFKFNPEGPNRLDLIYMRALEALSPFGAKGQKGKVFHECAIWLKNDAGTRAHFRNLSDSPNSRVLQVRYTQLKTWLAAAEGWSKMDSGTEEDDEELRHLIRSVQDEEETSRALRLAGQEEREAVKGRSLLAEAVREEFANKAVENLKSSLSPGEKDTLSPGSSRKGKQAANRNGSSEELTVFRGELGRWNEVSMAAQAEQNSRINQLYERELGIAQERIEHERIIAQSLADHRTAELALQVQRLEFEKDQGTSSKTALDTLEAKISTIEMNTSNRKFDVLEAQMTSMNDAIAVMMKHLVGGSSATPLQ
ncbi:hypothetical protein DFH28DRAFT_1079366 [Melampsora americana]|nr:hypothetical protein DFH28DRAFT_1079366 [Melampsora americana]